MDNHYYAIVETALERLSAGCPRLNGLHAQHFNERHGRVGHLFQGRFDARVLRDDEHLARACAYVWNNPVRARALRRRRRVALERPPLSRAQAQAACTGESAGAHEQSGETSPPRPFSCRYPSACSACISLWICVVPS
jgi:hypothetical protein